MLYVLSDTYSAEDEVDEANRSSLSSFNPVDLEKWNDSDWTILNVDFGIPLFDSQLNRDVCERITSHQLWQKDTLDILTEFQQSLSQRLLKFIREFVGNGIDWKTSLNVPLPTRALLFADGKLDVYNEI